MHVIFLSNLVFRFRGLQASTALLEEMRRQPFRCSLSGAAYFATWKRNGVGRPIERSRSTLLQLNKPRCGESKEQRGKKSENLPSKRLELVQNGAHRFVAHKPQGRNSKGCARSPFDGCCRQLLTLQIGGEMMSKGPFKRFANEQCSRQRARPRRHRRRGHE